MEHAQDFGPVPVSRFKDEAQRVYQALGEGRRVLVSRHGRVVVVINPPSVADHGRLLASYALRRSPISELSATDVGQGSPSEAVRRAEAGESVLMTRQNKVWGVLGPPEVAETVEAADAQEEQLAAFAQAHPHATLQDFAEASQGAAARNATRTADVAVSRGANSNATAVLVDALLVEGRAHEAGADLPAAASAFESGLEFRQHPDPRVRSKVAELMVELARVYTHEGRAGEAVGLAKDAVDLLKPYAGNSDGVGLHAGYDSVAVIAATSHEREIAT